MLNLTKEEKSNLESLGVMSNQYTVDENWLRIRNHYDPLAMYVYQLSDGSWLSKAEDTLIHPEVMTVIGSYRMITFKLVQVIPKMLSDSSYMRTYRGLCELLINYENLPLIQIAKERLNGETNPILWSKEAEKYLNKYDLRKAMSIQHPDGDEGVIRSCKMLETNSQDIIFAFKCNDFYKSI